MFAESVHRILGTDTIKKEVPALLEQPSLGQMKGVQETLHVENQCSSSHDLCRFTSENRRPIVRNFKQT